MSGLTALNLPHGALPLPAFLPDGTLGAVRAVDSEDLVACGIRGLVMNTFHLMQHPGSSTVQALGGLHAMSGWERPIVTDSGGFQAYSLIRQNARYGALTDNGIVFRPEDGGRKLLLTPEKCIQLQFGYGADILMCLDDCTHVDDSPSEQETSARRTVAWAARCKEEYERQVRQRRLDERERPLLFAVIQGGGSKTLRAECAEALLRMGFDGYGYGGWPLDAEGNLLENLLAYTRSLVPAQYPMHALGVGHPKSIATCIEAGYEIFDSALPTRDARQGRLYVGDGNYLPGSFKLPGRFRYLYVRDDKYIKDGRPVDETCDCLACRRYSRGYLHHLYRHGEINYMRLATIHNLRFMARLMDSYQTEPGA